MTRIETNKQNLYFLCSIEKALTIDDVKFILTDSDICTEELTFIMPESSFKSKKFLIVESSNKVKLLKFTVAFSKSHLNGTWFIRSTPPKGGQRIENENSGFTNGTQQRKQNISYHNKKGTFSDQFKNASSVNNLQNLLPLYNNNNKERQAHVQSNKMNFRSNNFFHNRNAGLLPTPQRINQHDYELSSNNDKFKAYSKSATHNNNQNNIVSFLEQALTLAKMK